MHRARARVLWYWQTRPEKHFRRRLCEDGQFNF
jgi:hypothetical protein